MLDQISVCLDYDSSSTPTNSIYFVIKVLTDIGLKRIMVRETSDRTSHIL